MNWELQGTLGKIKCSVRNNYLNMQQNKIYYDFEQLMKVQEKYLILIFEIFYFEQ